MNLVLTSADYVLVAVTVISAVLGLFGGFSGALGFCAGVVAAGTVAKFGYAPVNAYFPSSRLYTALVLIVVALLAFGIARAIVRKIVHGLLAQPADALLGALVGGVTGAAAGLVGIYLALRFMGMEIESTLYRGVIGLV